MTVITIPSAEKKSDIAPLVTNIEIDPAVVQAKDLEAGNLGNDRPVQSKYLILRIINDRVYSLWALIYVLLMSLLITFMMLYGEHIYKAIGNAFNDETDTYYGTGTIAINDKLSLPLNNFNNDDYEDTQMDDFNQLDNVNQLSDFQLKKLEDFYMGNNSPVSSDGNDAFEIDLNEDNYEKINPLLPLGNSARFIHDFSANVTGIVDVENKRCYVMPLNRNAVLPPKSLHDLLSKMSNGYYAVDTRNVMHNMRVIQPAIKNIVEYGIYITKYCADYQTFKLEKIVYPAANLLGDLFKGSNSKHIQK